MHDPFTDQPLRAPSGIALGLLISIALIALAVWVAAR